MHTFSLVHSKLQRLSRLCHHQLRFQACASAFFQVWLASVRLLRVLLACVFSSRCLLSFWCYRSPVRAGYSIVCPQQMKMVHFNSVYRCLRKSFVQITRCLAEEGHIMAYTSLSVVTKKQGWSRYSRKMTTAKTTTDCVPRSHLLDSEIVE